MLCQLKTSNIEVLSGQEMILRWDGATSHYHTKPEYIKIIGDGDYQIQYEIKWRSLSDTTQPLCLTIYRITKDYFLERINEHVTVCVGRPITVRKKWDTSLKAQERICIGAKNMSSCNFILMELKFSLQ